MAPFPGEGLPLPGVRQRAALRELRVRVVRHRPRLLSRRARDRAPRRRRPVRRRCRPGLARLRQPRAVRVHLARADGGRAVLRVRPHADPAERRRRGRSRELLPGAERAKRHLLFELDTLGFGVEGLVFDLLSSVAENVVIGHDEGVITIDLAESDAAHREKVRANLAEPYRTMLGHFRHEIGHFYEWQLVRGPELMARCTRAVRRRDRRLPGGDRPALRRRRTRGLGGVVHLDLRDHAPVRGLRRDLGALPAHLRHRRDGRPSTASPRSRRSARSRASVTSSPACGPRSRSRST